MTTQPYVLLSCAMSADGCLDGRGQGRLILSGRADLDRVDDQRAGSDAIMVGAATLRRDNPRLLIRSPQRRAARLARGLPEHPARVTLTASGDLDPGAHFFSGPAPAPRLVYCPDPLVTQLERRLGGRAEVTGAGQPVRLGTVLTDLAHRGVGRLMVEAGARLGREFLAAGLADELQLAVAPFFVGDPGAPRFAGPGRYPHGPDRPMILAGVHRLDDVVVLRYLLGGAGHGARGGHGAGAGTARDGDARGDRDHG